MGLSAKALMFLLSARSSGVDFARTVMLGRQELVVDARTISHLFTAFGDTLSMTEAKELVERSQGYAEPIFRRLGAAEVASVDASSFEGATIVHDLNFPIDTSLQSTFTAVLDGGTLEHVFNFQAGIQNAMEMVEPGGHLLTINPANRCIGHGFYQFSPDLHFRTLDPRNGFAVERILLGETRRRGRWYLVADPQTLKHPVFFPSNREVYLYSQARRTSVVPLFKEPPQQSTYSDVWERARHREPVGIVPFLKARLPPNIVRRGYLLRSYYRSHSAEGRDAFRQVDLTSNLVTGCVRSSGVT